MATKKKAKKVARKRVNVLRAAAKNKTYKRYKAMAVKYARKASAAYKKAVKGAKRKKC